MVLSNHLKGEDCNLQDKITIKKFNYFTFHVNHFVFHVSLLKMKIEEEVVTSSTLLVMDELER